jgi:hypothetical protein
MPLRKGAMSPAQRAAIADRQRKRYKSLPKGPNGQILPKAAQAGDDGWSGSPNLEARSRRRLTLATLEGMQRAFDKGGQRAINRVMREAPAIFLKMLVLLVPREMNVEHSGSVKEMTDQQIDDAIAAIKLMIADRERQTKMIDVTPAVGSSPTLPQQDEPSETVDESDG